jgi:hypothetical protein
MEKEQIERLEAKQREERKKTREWYDRASRIAALCDKGQVQKPTGIIFRRCPLDHKKLALEGKDSRWGILITLWYCPECDYEWAQRKVLFG